MKLRLPFLRRGGVCDALLAHVSNVRGSSVQTALDLDEWIYVKVERLEDLHRNGKSLSGSRLDVAIYSLLAVIFVHPSVFREAIWFGVVEGRDLHVVADGHLGRVVSVCRSCGFMEERKRNDVVEFLWLY